MKKMLIGAGAALMGLVAFTGCIEDRGNKIQASNVFCTVTATKSPSTKVLEMEGLSAYVYADEINALSLNTGSRVYITRFTLDYDNQPAYANGSKDNPLKLTEVTHRDLTKMSITTENESNKLMNDSLDLFYSPYVHMSTLGPYLNLAGNIRKEGAPVFEMVQIPSDSKDTLKYELKMGYRVAPNEKESDSYLSSVLLPDIEKGKEQVVTVKFRAKRKGGTNGKFMNDSVWVATYKK